MRSVTYAISEAFMSLRRERGSGVFSIVTIAGALLVFAVFLLVAGNLERLLATWSTGAELSVYIRDNATAADLAAIERVLAGSAVVERREYVSKEDALKRFSAEFKDLAGVAAESGSNPFPASWCRSTARPSSARPRARIQPRLRRVPARKTMF